MPVTRANDVHDRFIAARLNGHSWQDINEHMQFQRDLGATRADLGYNGSRQEFNDRMTGSIARDMGGALGTQVAMNDNDPIMGHGSMIPGVGGPGLEGAMQLKGGGPGGARGTGGTAKLTNYKQSPEGDHYYEISKGGENIGFVQVNQQGYVMNTAVEGRDGTLGFKDTMSLGKQLFENHPEFKELGGWRVRPEGKSSEVSIPREKLMGPEKPPLEVIHGGDQGIVMQGQSRAFHNGTEGEAYDPNSGHVSATWGPALENPGALPQQMIKANDNMPFSVMGGGGGE